MKMKAIVKHNHADTTFSIKEISVPEIGKNELLVRVHAIGVGIHDGYFLPVEMKFPYTIGIEAAGIIEEVGQGVDGFVVGERIAFVSMMQAKGGPWAEYAAVSKDSLILKMPDTMDFTTAAALPVAGNTVLKAFQALKLKSGDSLFIAGASGAIGTFAIQLAKKEGVEIAGSASEKNHDYMKSLGADFTVDYHDTDWQTKIREWKPNGVDAALAIQPKTGPSSMEVVKDGGIVVPVSDEQFGGERNISVNQFPYQADVKKELTKMLNQIVQNDMHVTIEKIYPFDEAIEALNKTRTRSARGKIVILLAEK